MLEHQLTTLPGGERVDQRAHRRRPLRRARALDRRRLARRAGAREPGVSHFIEHLLFKGSSRYSAQEIAELFDAMGGELNAATSRETTVVYTRVPDDHLEQALDAMVDMVFEPSFADLDSEREVVLEEIAMVEDNPQDLVHDIAAEVVFGTHPLGRPVIGSADVISSVSRRCAARYHGGAYVGGNVVLAAAGNVDHERLVELLSGGAMTTRGTAAARAARRCSGSPRRACASCARTRSSTTSCSPGPASHAPTSGGTRRRSSMRSSAARHRPASSRRSARSAAWRTASTATARSSQRPGRSASTSGTRADNLAECLDVAAAELRDVGDGQPARGRARAGEGEPARPAAALAGIDLEPDDPPRPGSDHRRRDRVRGGDDRARSRRSPPTTSRRSRVSCSRRRRSRPRDRPAARSASATPSARFNPQRARAA